MKSCITELFKQLTDVIIDASVSNPLVEEQVKALHQSLALELAMAYMGEHGYELTAERKFVEKQETLIF